MVPVLGSRTIIIWLPGGVAWAVLDGARHVPLLRLASAPRLLVILGQLHLVQG